MAAIAPRNPGRAARRKGSEFEREVARIFDRFGFSGLCRTPNSGGLKLKCDLRLVDGSSHGFGIECKAQESISIWKCLAQTLRQARPAEVPLLVFKRDRRVPTGAAESYVWACLPLEDLLGLAGAAREEAT